VWELFCPDLTLKSRLLDITVAPSSEEHAHEHSGPQNGRLWTAKDGRILDVMTLERRRVLAVNQESRAMAVKTFPDYLSLDLASRQAIVRFNRNTDVVLLTGYDMDYHGGEHFHFPDFAEKITQVAISSTFGVSSTKADTADIMKNFLEQFPNLKRAYFLLESQQHNSLRNLRWCVPGYVHESFVDIGTTARPGEDGQMIFCWPDMNEHVDLFQPFQKAYFMLPNSFDEELVVELLHLGIESLPMVIFQSKSGLALYKRLQERHKANLVNSDSQSDECFSITTSESASDNDEQESGRTSGSFTIEDDESSNNDEPAQIAAGFGSDVEAEFDVDLA
jgi:hypothetical protein